MRVAVLGGSGFVGAGVVRALRASGHEVRVVKAPRLRTGGRAPEQVRAEAALWLSGHTEVLQPLREVDVVVNAAGVADATTSDVSSVFGATPCSQPSSNRPPGATWAGWCRSSSAAVQGRRDVLDQSRAWEAFSPYAASKVLAERVLLDEVGVDDVVVLYRPTSVQGAERGVTRQLHRLASSPLSSVAGAGDAPTPQILLPNVADAVRHVVEAVQPPPIVLHPWEGLTTGSLLTLLGDGRVPRHVPSALARRVVSGLYAGSRLRPGLAGLARRVEMLWFGQRQSSSWLTDDGWSPVAGQEAWRDLATALRRHPVSTA